MRQGYWVPTEIVESVERLLRNSGPPRLKNGVGIDVAAIITDYCNLDLARISNLQVRGRLLLALYVPELRAVLVEEECHPYRQRFSMAHELGHAQLEDNFGQADSLFDLHALKKAYFCDVCDMSRNPVDERSNGRRRRLEIRANQFAAQLLMPSGLVREVWSRHPDIPKCCDVLGVSKQALEIRLGSLDLGWAKVDGSSRRLAL
jgi:hypothetical protein